MSDKKINKTKVEPYNIVGIAVSNDDGKTYDGQFLQLPIDITPKGLRSFTLDLDEYEIAETGTKTKDGKPVIYMKFKFSK